MVCSFQDCQLSLLTTAIKTGSAHAALIPYYLNYDDSQSPGPESDAIVIEAYQLSERGGRLICSLEEGIAKLVGEGAEMGKGTITGHARRS